jgi:hypothetical protein
MVAVALTVTGIAVAATRGSGVIHSCYSTRTGAIRIVKDANCRPGEKPLAWNRRGPTGARGARGFKGAAGARGVTGPGGATGPFGATGPLGPTGITGVAGATGPVGSTGITGATGATGATGGDGKPGEAGSTGATGATGGDGKPGQNGTTGPTGPKGATGASGPIGSTGRTGTTGSTGSTGPSTIVQSGIVQADGAGLTPDQTLASSGTLTLVGRCVATPLQVTAELVLKNTSGSAVALWDGSTAATSSGNTIAAGGEAVTSQTPAVSGFSGEAIAQTVFSALSTDGSHLSVQAWAAAGPGLVPIPHDCEYDATELQGAPGS